MKNNGPRSAEHYSRVHRDIAEKIQKYGWTLISVFDPDKGTHFVYTVGLEQSFEHPELIVLDLPVDVACEMLNGLAELISDGRYFRAGERPRDLPVHPAIRFYRVNQRHYRDFLNVGRWFYGGENFRALQIAPADTVGALDDGHLILNR